MTLNYDKPTRVLTVTFSPREDRILTRVNQATSGNAVKNMFETWLLAQAETFTQYDIRETRDRLATVSDAELSAVRTTLGLP